MELRTFRAQFPHQRESVGIDLGSAMTILFTDQQWKLVVGHSRGDRVWKFPCGKIEEKDCPVTSERLMGERAFANAAARQCAVRELEAEVGIPEQLLQFIHQLKYVRTWTVRDRATSTEKVLQQFHFIGIMPELVELPLDVSEGDEMDQRDYWSVAQVFKRAMQPRFSSNKFNPFHAIGLVEALIFLRNTIGHDPIFESFRNMLADLEKENLHIDTLSYELDDQIKTRRI